MSFLEPATPDRCSEIAETRACWTSREEFRYVFINRMEQHPLAAPLYSANLARRSG